MATYRDEGVVLRTVRLGEADRIVTLATPVHGKVRAVAKGVRRTKSRIGARVEPLTHVTLLCWKGRELDVVTQVEVLDSFRAIREDLDRMAPALTMLEIVDQVAVEQHPMGELFTTLVGALSTLESSDSPLVLAAFCWRLLVVEGVAPVVDSCVRCGSDGPLVAFDAAEGGFCCRECRRGPAVSPESVEIVRRIVGGGIRRVLDEGAHESDGEVEQIAIRAVERLLDRRLRTTRHALDSGAPRAASL
ncbi:MAG: DNA repair protein RecO [Actinomycetota bacterium]|nr:DNA repair protein RecO [Actinomycetota bacterium]